MHKNENFDCTLCRKTFKRRDCFRRHQLSIHHRKTEVTCSKCDKKFARKDNLKKHIKFCCVCRQCYKNFESICSVPKNCPNYVDSQSHKKYL